MIPPPQTMTIKIPDAAAVYFPNPSTARLKMPPHITEVHNPQRIRNMTFIGIMTVSSEPTKELTFTPIDVGKKIAPIRRIKPKQATKVNIDLLEK